MTYPNTFLTKRFRRLFFLFLVLIFFISAPLLIMYSIGYRIDLKGRKIIETGVVSIDIFPRDSEIYLSNVLMTKKDSWQTQIPLRLTNLSPGIYNVRITKLGYRPWEKNIDIKSKQTTYIKNITLLKDKLPVPIFVNNEKVIKSITPSSDGSYLLLLSEQAENNLIELYNPQTSSLQNIYSVKKDVNFKVEWSPFDNSFAIVKNENSSSTLHLFSAEDTNINKTYNLTGDASNLYIQWQKNTITPTLFLKQNGHIVRVTPAQFEKIYKVEDTDIWYVDDQDDIWISRNNEISIVTDDNEKQNKIVISNDEKIQKILDINEERAVTKTENNILVTSRKEENVTETIHATSYILNPSTKEWLVWSPWELWSVYEHDKPALLNRTSDSIIFVFPLDKVGALLIANSDGITAFNPGYYVSQHLFSDKIKGASVNQKMQKIYFLGKVADKEGLFELEY